MTTTPDIAAHRLDPTSGDFHATQAPSCQLERGEPYALLGASSAARTSTLAVIERHRLSPTGAVFVVGKSPTRRRTGPDVQSCDDPWAAVDRQHTDTAERVLSIVDLTQKAGNKVSQLSGGEKRRLDFATAVYGSPELVFLDEPTTGLDIQSRDDLWDAVDKLREDGSTIVLTTHYLEEAQQRADRIGLMHRGVFHREGTVVELTQTLPSVIRFSLPDPASLDDWAPTLALQPSRENDGSFVVETFNLQRELKALLDWAEDHAIELHGLSSGPTSLDDVFRAIGHDTTAA